MSSDIIAFLVMLNPFALFIYLQPVMKELSGRDFAKVLLRASLISFLIFYIFALSGDFIFSQILQINFEAFRVFGGIIIFSSAFLFILNGKYALLHMKEDLDDLASEISLPFMVGAGTISLSILLGEKFRMLGSLAALFTILAINYGIIIFLKFLRSKFPRRLQIAFDKFMEIFLRITGFFIGAIALNMALTGIHNLYF